MASDDSAIGRSHRRLARKPPSMKHPPYATMIKDAIAAEDKGSGSSRHAINKWIKTLYSDLPKTHEALLDFNLRKLCHKGQITKLQKIYKLADSESSKSSGDEEGDDEPLPPPIQVPFAELKPPVTELDFGSIPRRPRSGRIQIENAISREDGSSGYLQTVEPRWVVGYEHVQSKVEVVQGNLKRILDGVTPYLVEEIAESSRLANAMKVLYKLSSMDILASQMQAGVVQEHQSLSLNVVHSSSAQPIVTPSSSNVKRSYSSLRKSVPKSI